MQGDSAVHTSLKILPVPQPKKPVADRIASAGGGGREGGREAGRKKERGRRREGRGREEERGRSNM